MLIADMLEANTRSVEIGDFTFEIVEAMIHFIYTGIVPKSFTKVRELLKIGEKYQVKSLVDECGKKIMPTISRSNALEIGIYAETYSAQNLVEKCAEFIFDNLDVLDSDWDEKVKNSPKLLTGIVKCVKEESVVEVFRFGNVAPAINWKCAKNNTDAITFKLSDPATLICVGLFGNGTTNVIPVRLDVISHNSSEVVFLTQTSYVSTGNGEPIKVPVRVQLEAGNKYTVRALIDSGVEHTFFGENGRVEMNVNSRVKVHFSASDESTNFTGVKRGQVPLLGFKI